MDFILLINKEKNKTSRDMVNELNHIFSTKKIGHTGTLDPLATGILVIAVGKYTKTIDKLTFLDKEYIAEIKLGIKTDTLDITGNVLEEKREEHVSKDDILKEFTSLIGSFKQKVPDYSAKKVNGKKLYEYARNNEKVPEIYNDVEIKELELLEYKEDIIKFRCLVSKGTYIRSIIEKICNDLNIIGTMNNLTRTKQGIFDIKNSYTIEDVQSGNFEKLYLKDILNIDCYNLSLSEYNKVKNGAFIEIKSDKRELLLIYDNKEIAIYKKEGSIYKPDIMLV